MPNFSMYIYKQQIFHPEQQEIRWPTDRKQRAGITPTSTQLSLFPPPTQIFNSHHIWVTHINTTKLLYRLRQQIRLKSLGGENARVLQRAATAAQSMFTVVGGSLCALILLDYSKLVLLFTIMFGQWSERKKHFKVFKRNRVERQPVFLCSLTYCKVLVITKVTYAQRLGTIAINSSLCTVYLFIHTDQQRPLSSPQADCRWWVSKKEVVCQESCSDARGLWQDSGAWRALSASVPQCLCRRVWRSAVEVWRCERVWQDCSPAPEQKAGKKSAV